MAMSEEELYKHQQDALFRDVEEQLRIENMKKFWAKYGDFFIGSALFILLSVGGMEVYKNFKQSIAYDVGNEYLSSLFLISEGKDKEALSHLSKIASEGKNGLSSFAKVYEANLSDKDASKYLELSKDEKLYEPVREFLALSYAYQIIDTKSEQEVMDTISGLEGKRQWIGAVNEIKALALLKSGKQDEAFNILNNMLNNNDVSKDYKDRAKKILQTVKK
ncbi:MAG: hypothetical protein BWY78_01284 [Alphaproteobacteria bacterium ADurb.Bin438]|nr:MAG: hypothetical protein BWY78_01284 [Alphaproteobacteria bacterium ADurb.Bin438]